ncbi:O-antigen polysaccharide polymerase Wzy [Bacteroides sp. AN502(2024)]|uniref:O-antigen polysaccharide polymerase Wzy n=1 Tax=Bacteroides sp. AN502(2024) TaxID=3160599 RepID=UPI00351867C4
MNMIFSVFGIILSLFLWLFSITGKDDSLSGLYPLFLVLIICYIILFYISDKKNDGSLSNWGLRPTYICLIGLIIVNLQFFFDESFCARKIGDFIPVSWAEQYYDKCFFGGCLFIVLFLLANYHTRNFPSVKCKTGLLPVKSWVYIQLVFFLLFVITIDIESFLTGTIYVGSGASNADGGLSASFERFYDATSLIALALYTQKMVRSGECVSVKKYIKSISIVFWLPLCVYVILRLFSGDRGPVIYSTLSIIYSYTFVSKKIINIKVAVLFIAAGAFAVTLLGFIRSRSTELSFTEKVEQSLIRMNEKKNTEIQSFSPFTKELASSLRCNFVAVRAIEEGDANLSFGKFTILSSISSFPGARKEYFKPLGLSDEDFSSAVYLTQLSNKSKTYTYGIGSSVFAEAYLDLNIWGVIIVAILLGRIFKCIDLSYRYKELSPIVIIVIIRLAAMAIYVSRDSFSHWASYILSVLIIYWIINPFLKIFLDKG